MSAVPLRKPNKRDNLRLRRQEVSNSRQLYKDLAHAEHEVHEVHERKGERKGEC